MRTKATNRQSLTTIAIVFAVIFLFGVSVTLSPVSPVEASETSVTASRVKVCKISADPTNIPIGTAFTFEMTGTAASGALTTYTFDVLAGPSSQGGFCAFAPDTWVDGSPLFIGEKGLSAANRATLPLGTEATRIAIRISSIVSDTTLPSYIAAAVFPSLTGLSNPEFRNPATGYVGHSVIFVATNWQTEITFTDFVYRPAALKLCNVAGVGMPPGTPFSFNIAPADPLTTWPYPTAPFTVNTGSCAFVNGPFPGTEDLASVGLFNQGTGIIVTEVARPGTQLCGITSSTLTGTNPPGTLNVNLPNRNATLTLNQPLVPPGNLNEITFTTGIPDCGGNWWPRPTRFDFDGDGRSDVAAFRPSDGTWYHWASSGRGLRGIRFGQAGDIPVAADYDGDGITDAAVYRNGQWYILGSAAGFSSAGFGLPTDVPLPGDFDGDGKADFAVFRQSNGTWYIMGSTTGFKAVQFGISTDLPVSADFDGDGRADPAVYRDGTWYILGSTAGFKAIQFGIAGDKPVQADYDGDGRADVAVYRGGTWYILSSTAGFSAVQFGIASDTPVPADYDGDGRTDIAVYRSSDTYWYILNSSQSGNAVGGFSSMQFGTAGDLLMRY